jgi:DNA-directed RNA polymerase specialized sigma24 family protein
VTSGLPTRRENGFAEFLARIRTGDEEAAALLVKEYEPIIRREVRMRLTDPRLYRLFDSMDICQSVLGSFFVRAAAGQYELHRPEDLRNLLVAMAHNKLITRARKLPRQEVEKRRTEAPGWENLENVVDSRPGPAQIIAGRDLLQEVLDRLPQEERGLADLRMRGHTWPEVAAEIGGTAEGRRGPPWAAPRPRAAASNWPARWIVFSSNWGSRTARGRGALPEGQPRPAASPREVCVHFLLGIRVLIMGKVVGRHIPLFPRPKPGPNA